MKNNLLSICSFKRWLLLLACCILAFCSLDAQSITWAIVNAAGFEDGVDGSLRWTIGEPLTTETNGEDGTLRVGFMPFAFVEDVTTLSRSLDPDIEISISPNPASDQILVQVPGQENQMIRILSLDGKSRMAADINTEAHIDIRSLPAGPYVLYVIDPTGSFNSTTFIKS